MTGRKGLDPKMKRKRRKRRRKKTVMERKVRIWKEDHRCVRPPIIGKKLIQTQEPKVISISGPSGNAHTSFSTGTNAVKVEPTEFSAPESSAMALDGNATQETEPTNVLIPKKRRARRSPSSDEDLPPPPPPMRTIRLERDLLPQGETLEWNILDDAREKGMVDVWTSIDEERDGAVNGGMELDAQLPDSSAGPVAGLFEPDGGDEDAEDIARRLEEKYGDKKKKVKVIGHFLGVA